MFGLSKKERATEALRRGALAATVGGFLHASDVEKLGLNHKASSFIYADSIAHHIQALMVLFAQKLSKTEYWATPVFFKIQINQTLVNAAVANGLSPDAYSFVLTRMQIFNSFDSEALAHGAHYLLSANEAKRFDPSTNPQAVARLLQQSTEAYFATAKKMFE